MIVRPPAANLLEVVRSTLRTSVTPAVEDQRVLTELGMIDSMLGTLIARWADEPRLIAEEVAAVEALAEQVIDETGDDGASEALIALRAVGPIGGGDPIARYDAAGELLSRCLEAAVPAGGDLRASAEAVLWQRMQHQSEIHGTLAVHGR